VHAFSHITGGGLTANLARSLPGTVDAVLHRSSWTPPPVFSVLQSYGDVIQADMDKTLNMGVGMAAIVAPEAVEGALKLLADRGVPAWILGGIIDGTGAARLEGNHA
jgi:phosphoribosylformylglycinamidine cyclo-ligase